MQLEQRTSPSGITEPMLRSLLRAFYERVRADDVLGPIFLEAIGEDWSEHMERIASFWLTATRLGGGYNGRAFMPAHLRHPFIRAEHVARWLQLFGDACEQFCPPEIAAYLLTIAEKMAENLRISLDLRARQPKQN